MSFTEHPSGSTEEDRTEEDRTEENRTEENRTEERPGTGLHPAVLATAIALPVALIVGVIVAAVIANRSPVLEPVALSTIPADRADGAECASLIAASPEALGERSRAELADPAPAGAAAWQSEGAEPVVLRCGLDRPEEFDQAAALQVVNGVQWFQVSGADQGVAASTYFAVDRAVYVALTVPDGSGPTPLQSVSDAIVTTLPQTPIDPAPLR